MLAQLERALPRVSVPGAAGQAELEDLIRPLERDEAADAVVGDDAVRRIQEHASHGAARLASEEPRGARQDSVGKETRIRRATIVGELSHADHLAEPTPVSPGPAAVRKVALLEDEHGRPRLEELHRRVRRAGRPE